MSDWMVVGKVGFHGNIPSLFFPLNLVCAYCSLRKTWKPCHRRCRVKLETQKKQSFLPSLGLAAFGVACYVSVNCLASAGLCSGRWKDTIAVFRVTRALSAKVTLRIRWLITTPACSLEVGCLQELHKVKAAFMTPRSCSFHSDFPHMSVGFPEASTCTEQLTAMPKRVQGPQLLLTKPHTREISRSGNYNYLLNFVLKIRLF